METFSNSMDRRKLPRWDRVNSETIRTIRLPLDFVGENDGKYPNQRDREEILSVDVTS
jgi:hypothetical protein